MKIFAVIALLIGIGAVPALADATYDFNISGSGLTASGTITVATTGTPGVDDIIGITGTFSTSNDGGFSGAITGMPVGSFDSSNPSSNGLSVWDNLLYPAGDSPAVIYNSQTLPGGNLLDGFGLLFDVAGGYTVNVWGNGSGQGYALSDGISTYVDNTAPVSFTVPDGGTTLALLGLAVAGMAGLRRKLSV